MNSEEKKNLLKIIDNETEMHKICRGLGKDIKNVKEIPKELLNEEFLTVKNLEGRTPLHDLIKSELEEEQYKKIFKEVKINSFLIKDSNGITPLHYILGIKDLSLVPRNFLATDLLLLTRCKEGKRPLFFLGENPPKQIWELLDPMHNSALLGELELVYREENKNKDLKEFIKKIKDIEEQRRNINFPKDKRPNREPL